MLRKVLEMEHLFSYRCSVRGTCREGSNTEDSERYVMADSGNGAFIGLHKGNLRQLAKEGSANTFIGLGYCPLKG
jgi:hypothetical protein